VPVPLADAWRFLARVEEWPRWAAHIRRIDMTPPGDVGPESSGAIILRSGLRSTFRMTEFHPPRNWKWAGGFLWLTVHYDHQFEAVDASRTRLTWIVDAEGFGAAGLGRIFAAAYAKNLDKAIPALVSEISLKGGVGGVAGAGDGSKQRHRGY
jgi:hypothetical protein